MALGVGDRVRRKCGMRFNSSIGIGTVMAVRSSDYLKNIQVRYDTKMGDLRDWVSERDLEKLPDASREL
jgi:hypothetical protein